MRVRTTIGPRFASPSCPARAATVDRTKVALRRVAETGPEALADVAEAEARALWRILALARQAVLAAIADFHLEAPGARLLRGDPKDHFVARRGDSIFDRILNHRLQDQRRKAGGLEPGRNVDLDLEPAREAHPLDVQIQALEGDLLG